jgi:2-phosphosulfolactate phosphatase
VTIEPIRHLEVCISPALLPYYEVKGRIVVLVDIFRATSAICSALASGVKEIIPVESIEEAHDYKDRGYLVAAERLGAVVNGFDFGNSPYAFMESSLKGQTVVLTTTNCTSALHQVEKEASEIVLGAFSNISALTAYLLSKNDDVLVLCSGWKNRVNMEDTMFAGALAERLNGFFRMQDDSARMAIHFFDEGRINLREFLWESSHSQRLKHLNIEKDILYCLECDKAPVIPYYNGQAIVAKN